MKTATFARFALVTAMASPLQAAGAQPGVESIPLRAGLTIVSALRFPDGDRENVVTVRSADALGVTYQWHASQAAPGGRREETFTRFVSRADLENAARLHTVFRPNDQADYPGYTAFSLSTGVFDALRATGEAAFSITGLQPSALPLAGSVRHKGELRRVAPQPERFSLLVNGRPVTVPALHVRGHFAGQAQDLELRVLADETHPLLLETLSGADALRVVSIEMPGDDAFERDLAEQCRAELPGIHFAFGTADIDPSSGRTLDRAAKAMAANPRWVISIEGHTDNIGANVANQILSVQRARSVQDALAARGIENGRLTAIGFGAARPRAPNDTLEGRARNRRVELVRQCTSKAAGESHEPS